MGFLTNLGFGKKPAAGAGAAPQWGTRDAVDLGGMSADTMYGEPDDYGNYSTLGSTLSVPEAKKKGKGDKFRGKYKEGLAAMQASGLFDEPEPMRPYQWRTQGLLSGRM